MKGPFDISAERDAELDRQIAEARRYGDLEWRPPEHTEKCERCGTLVVADTVDGVRGLGEYVGHDFRRDSFYRPHTSRRCDAARASALSPADDRPAEAREFHGSYCPRVY